MADVPPTEPKDAEPATAAANRAMLDVLPFEDREDYVEAARGLIAALPEGVVRTPAGSVMWNLGAYGFLNGREAPPTVNPSLWRNAQLNMNNGLFKVVDRVFQIRGVDLANMTIVEGDTGLILIDPLGTAEVSRCGLDLYFQHRPQRPVHAVIYTHSHVDHYGGAKGVATEEDARAGRVKVIAPDGFMEAVGGENVLAGVAMTRRAMFQFGPLLLPGERGQVDAGLGKNIARGQVTLIPPNDLIVQKTERRTIDGVEIEFQLAPGSEAPAEMHMFFPQFAVLNMAENATPLLHNFIPLRGAVARDTRLWSRYIAEAMRMYGDRTEALIAQHHWPTWGRAKVMRFLARQRDLYKHIHDQALRMANLGLRPAEIAETLQLPRELQRDWTVRGYYGTVSHNAKAVFQRYLSWYDGNPSNLNPLPPVPGARKLVEYMGGADAVIARARADFAKGEFRWVAQVMNQVVFADPANRAARELCADALEQLGYQAESATWRNAYLFGARELRMGPLQLNPRSILSPDLIRAITTETFFDFMGVRLNADRAAGHRFVIDWRFSDTGQSLVLNLENSTLTHMPGPAADATLVVTTTRPVLDSLMVRQSTVTQCLENGGLKVQGDAGMLDELFSMLDDFPLMFDILTPTTKGGGA
ncbi:MAG: MBL fold metallo-hydrolase [Alphaproteobacteria bacterium]|nr:MBL fold metallo-hydrolase [Alphaproteobacteria bacterium]MCW5739278.1 MBL fold metallo-hydrolase [Alphaproteobacteria bacterium]